MRWLRLPVVAAVGVASLGAALLLPWVYYGGIEFRLYDIPGWPWYLTLALTQAVAVVASLFVHSRRLRTVALVATAALGAAAIAAAAVTMSTSLDLRNMFGRSAPPISPVLGPGSAAAVVAALAGVAAAFIAWVRRSAPREQAVPGRTPDP